MKFSPSFDTGTFPIPDLTMLKKRLPAPSVCVGIASRTKSQMQLVCLRRAQRVVQGPQVRIWAKFQGPEVRCVRECRCVCQRYERCAKKACKSPCIKGGSPRHAVCLRLCKRRPPFYFRVPAEKSRGARDFSLGQATFGDWLPPVYYCKKRFWTELNTTLENLEFLKRIGQSFTDWIRNSKETQST